MMGSNNPSSSSRMSLTDLLAQVDRLEREVRDLGREAERGEHFVRELEETINRDMKEGAEVEKKISSCSKDIRELEDREKFLINAVESSYQSSQLLVQMETKAKKKLEHEKNTTNDLFHKLTSDINKHRAKLEAEQEKLLQIPESSSLLSLESEISTKTQQLSHEEDKIKSLKRDIDALKKNDDHDVTWSQFQKTCVQLSESWLSARNKSIRSRDQQESSSSSIEASGDKGDTGDHVVEELEAMEVTDQGGDTLAKEAATLTKKIASLTKEVAFSQETDDPKEATEQSSSSDMIPAAPVDSSPLSPPNFSDMFEPEPPTPRTKSLHLKLGATLMSLKKSKQSSAGSDASLSPPSLTGTLSRPRQSPVKVIRGSKDEEMEVDQDQAQSGSVVEDLRKESSTEKKQTKTRSRPSSPVPRLLNSIFSNKSSDASPVKLKSFRLGLPSLFAKKKTSNDEETGQEKINNKDQDKPDPKVDEQTPMPQFSLLGSKQRSTPGLHQFLKPRPVASERPAAVSKASDDVDNVEQPQMKNPSPSPVKSFEPRLKAPTMSTLKTPAPEKPLPGEIDDGDSSSKPSESFLDEEVEDYVSDDEDADTEELFKITASDHPLGFFDDDDTIKDQTRSTNNDFFGDAPWKDNNDDDEPGSFFTSGKDSGNETFTFSFGADDDNVDTSKDDFGGLF